MKLSVIIPTHDRASILLQTLTAIEKQSLDQDQFEIIVVDDGSSTENLWQLREYKPPYNYRLIEKPHGGLATARNLGAQNARHEILHFLDDDVAPGADAFRQHLETHRREIGPVVVIGSLPYPPDTAEDSFLWYLEKSGHYDLYRYAGRKYPEGKPPLPPLNGNSSIARELFFAVGGYDETFCQYGSEDLEIGLRLAKTGCRFVYCPEAVGYHRHSKDFDLFCRDMEQAGESLIWIYKKHPEIKAAKKIDLLEDPFITLPGRKKILKLVLLLTRGCPWLLGGARAIIRAGRGCYALRYLFFFLHRWVAYYHYAQGMEKGLRNKE